MRPLRDLNKWSIRPGAQSARFPDSQLTVFTIRPLEKVSLMHCCKVFYSQNYVLLCRLVSLSLLDFFKFNLVHKYFRINAEYCRKLLCVFDHTIVSTQKVLLYSCCITIISDLNTGSTTLWFLSVISWIFRELLKVWCLLKSNAVRLIENFVLWTKWVLILE